MIKKMKLEIIQQAGTLFKLLIHDEEESCTVFFEVETKVLEIIGSNDLSKFLISNETQLLTMLHNKRQDSYYVGFKLDFSIIDGKDIAEFNNRNNIIIIDHGIISVLKNDYESKIIMVYTDASFDEKKKMGAYCVLKKDLNESYEAQVFSGETKSSNSAELEAVIKALEAYKEDVRIITDSQYVRKGITEWMIHWKLNNWKTANGTKAKNIDQWLKLEALCEGRRVEFGYVKAHNNHFENEYCDLMARRRLSKY